jgi:hypothetical protein
MEMLFLAFIALGNAENAVIREYGLTVFNTSKETNWERTHLHKLKDCKIVQAYFKALEVYDICEQEYLGYAKIE